MHALPGGHLRGTRASARRAARRCRPSPTGRLADARPAGGRARGVQGQHEPDGHAHHVLLAHAAQTTCPPTRQRAWQSASSTPAALPHRQAEHGRVRVRLLHRDLRLRPHAATRGISSACPGGSSGGSCGGRGCGHCAGVTLGFRHGRLHPPAGLSFCGHRGRQAHLRRGQSRYGVVAFGSSLDQVGPFARSVEDAALALNALCRPRRAGLHEPAVRRRTSRPTSPRASRGMRDRHRSRVHGGAKGLRPRCGRRWKRPRLFFEHTGRGTSWRWSLPHAQAAMSAYYVLGPCEAFSNLARFDSRALRLLRPGTTRIWPASTRPAARRASAPRRAAASCSAATFCRPACTTSTTIRPSRCARSSRSDYARGLRAGGLSSCRRWRRPRRSSSARSADPTEMYLVGHVHHLHQHRRQRRPVRSPSASAPTRAFRWACRSSRLPSRTRTCSGRRRPWKQHYGPAPVAPDFADGKVGA